MPHIVVKMYKGRTEEQKQAITEAVAKAVAETANCAEGDISLAIEEYDKAEWGEKVFESEIAPNLDSLYKKPKNTNVK